MPFPRIFHYSRCSPLKAFISTVHPSIPLYKVRFLLSFFLSPQPPLSLSFLEPIFSSAFIFFISFRSIEVRCILRVADVYKGVFKVWLFFMILRSLIICTLQIYSFLSYGAYSCSIRFFQPQIFTGNLRLRPSAMGLTDCSRRRSSSMAGCSFCTRSTQPAEIQRLINPLYGAYDIELYYLYAMLMMMMVKARLCDVVIAKWKVPVLCVSNQGRPNFRGPESLIDRSIDL